MKKYVNEDFDCEMMPTIGVDFTTKTLSIDDATLKLQIW